MSNCINIVLCINYSDYLKVVLNINSKIFHKIYVITEVTDENTINLISQYDNCEVFITNKKTQKKSVFNKSAIIREVQKKVHLLYKDYWICLTDADIELPLSFINTDFNKLNKKYIYGMPRYIYHSYNNYKYNIIDNIEISKTIIGYFQLYFNKNILYNRNSYDCSKCDDEFSFKFKKQKYLSNLTCKHLGKTCVNWKGRITSLFI